MIPRGKELADEPHSASRGGAPEGKFTEVVDITEDLARNAEMTTAFDPARRIMLRKLHDFCVHQRPNMSLEVFKNVHADLHEASWLVCPTLGVSRSRKRERSGRCKASLARCG
jgi:hypothetical protein